MERRGKEIADGLFDDSRNRFPFRACDCVRTQRVDDECAFIRSDNATVERPPTVHHGVHVVARNDLSQRSGVRVLWRLCRYEHDRRNNDQRELRQSCHHVSVCPSNAFECSLALGARLLQRLAPGSNLTKFQHFDRYLLGYWTDSGCVQLFWTAKETGSRSIQMGKVVTPLLQTAARERC